MRVVINGIPLLSRRSGIGNYIYHTFTSLPTLTKNWETTFFYGTEWSTRLRDQPTKPYVHTREYIQHLGISYPLYRKALGFLFSVGLWKRRCDLYHETNYIPMPFNGPIVSTIFDLSFYFFPETHPIARVRYLDRHFYPKLSRVSHFITISEAVKQEMIKHLGLSDDQITVTPLGVEEHFKPVFPNRLYSVINKYGLKADSYILYVGTLEPRKNLLNLLKAYARLPSLMRESYPLVLAGGAGWLMEGLDDAIQRLKIQKTVIKTGYIPKEDLPSFYSGAAVFVYPSIYEGFGLPLLEAMACGTPVITSSVSSLPEVVGDAGVLVHPEDFEKLADEMQDLLANPPRQQLLSVMGLERSKQFTWEKCAAKTLEVYHRVVQNK